VPVRFCDLHEHPGELFPVFLFEDLEGCHADLRDLLLVQGEGADGGEHRRPLRGGGDPESIEGHHPESDIGVLFHNGQQERGDAGDAEPSGGIEGCQPDAGMLGGIECGLSEGGECGGVFG
jgi:hypothetical protein